MIVMCEIKDYWLRLHFHVFNNQIVIILLLVGSEKGPNVEKDTAETHTLLGSLSISHNAFPHGSALKIRAGGQVVRSRIKRMVSAAAGAGDGALCEDFVCRGGAFVHSCTQFVHSWPLVGATSSRLH